MNTQEPLTVLVAGATGNQGGAVAHALLARGHWVRALTRDPASPKAEALGRLGAQIVQGDFDDAAALRRAARGVDAMFLMSSSFVAGPEREVEQARNAADAARASDVPHVVFNSVASADQNTGIPHFESKFRVEEHLRETGLPTTIIAPVAFMENATGPWTLPLVQQGVWPHPGPPEKQHPMISVPDIAKFDVLALEEDPRLVGRRTEVASDAPTPVEVARAISRAAGLDVRPVQMSEEQIQRNGPDIATMLRWMATEGYHVDIVGMRRRFPDVEAFDFATWAKRQDWRKPPPAFAWAAGAGPRTTTSPRA